ncbi:MAG: endonuclease [Planctomycetota bacterium]
MALLAALVAAGSAQAYDPPPGYYSTATGTGAVLQSQLHDIIDDHTVISYGSTRNPLRDIDRDPANPSNILLVYNRASIPGSSTSQWNREHTWPRSLGVGSSGPDNSDLHMLRPSDIGVNSARDSTDFGGAFGAQGFGNVFDGGRIAWYPGDADAGMIARQAFYADVRYDTSNGLDLELSNGDPGSPRLGDLARLIEWHFAAPPDDFERRRNDRIGDAYQFNRNPFIDHPEFAWSVFVDQANDSQITIAGGAAGVAGATTLDVDLGRVLVGSSGGAAQAVTLNKAGLDGTYYEVTTAGGATSSVTGRFNAFRSSQTDSRTITVGLDADTTTAGLRAGTVAINNLDITTGGGTGRGAGDGDDLINLSLAVVDHARPSFDPLTETLALTHDFGQVTQNAASLAFEFDIANLAVDAAFTAGLELTGVVGLGDASRFNVPLSTFTGDAALAGGDSRSYTARLRTDSVGEF